MKSALPFILIIIVAVSILICMTLIANSEEPSHPKLDTNFINQDEYTLPSGNKVNVFYDKKRNNTCYFYIGNISCVSGTENKP